MKTIKAIWKEITIGVLCLVIVLMGVLQPHASINAAPRFGIWFGDAEAQAAGQADISLGTNGTANTANITTALNALPSQGGLFHFKVGTYNITSNASGNITRAFGNMTIEGEGKGTFFTGNGTFVPGGSNWVFSNLAFNFLSTQLPQNATWDRVYTLDYPNGVNKDANGVYTVLNLTASQVTSTNGSFTQVTGVTGNYSTLNAPTGRGATYVIATNDAVATIKAQADAIFTGTNDSAMLQIWVNNVISSGGGTLLVVGNNSNLGTGTVTFNQTSLVGSFTLIANGVTFNYTGTGIAWVVQGNVASGAGHAEKRVKLSGFNLVGTSSATGAILMQSTMRDEISDFSISGFTGANAYGINQTSIDSNQFTEQNNIHDGTIGATIPLYFNNNSVNRMSESVGKNLRLTTAINGTGFLLSSNSLGLETSTFENIYVLLTGNNTCGFNFGNHQWIGSTFINPSVENPSSYSNTTAYTSQGFVNPNFVNPSIINTMTNSWNGTLANWYIKKGNVQVNPIQQFVSYVGIRLANVFYSFLNGMGTVESDLSGNDNYLTLFNSPTWGTKGDLGQITTASGQYGKTTNITMNGSLSIVVVTRPNFARNDGQNHYLFWWQVDASNYIFMIKDSNNTTWMEAGGGGQAIQTWKGLSNANWTANQTLVFVCTINGTTGKVFLNGVLDSTNTNASYNQTSTSGPLYLGASNTPNNYWTGDLQLFAVTPKVITQNESLSLTNRLFDLAGVNAGN